jgi:hypothetical protein
MMGMKIVNLIPLGGFGNQMMQYAFARAYCQRHGFELRCGDWAGKGIFQTQDPPVQERFHNRVRSELDLVDGEGDIDLHGYCQHQRCLIYTRTQARQWFCFAPEVRARLEEMRPADDTVVAHRRTGDYYGYGYVVVSEESYRRACREHGLDVAALRFVTEEHPLRADWLGPNLAKVVPDFYRLMQAPVLLRGNSTYSWWAAVLSTGRVFSPVIEGLAGGQDQEAAFVEGNWPRFANLEFITDLHMDEQNPTLSSARRD